MTDTSIDPPPLPVKPEEQGNGRIISAILAAFLASYCMTQLSLAGVDFTTLGISSELVKSSLIGIFVGVISKLTPRNIVAMIKDGILFCRDALISWRRAAREGKE